MSAAGELLQAAKELLAKGRCIGAPARDQDDNAVDPTDDSATKFSIYGALTRASYDKRNSTGLDAAMLLLGASDLHDPRLDGYSKHADDEALSQRFDDAIARADGGPVQGVSLDAERRVLDPQDPDYRKKIERIEGGESLAEAETKIETPRTQQRSEADQAEPSEDKDESKPGLLGRVFGRSGADKSDKE